MQLASSDQQVEYAISFILKTLSLIQIQLLTEMLLANANRSIQDDNHDAEFPEGGSCHPANSIMSGQIESIRWTIVKQVIILFAITGKRS